MLMLIQYENVKSNNNNNNVMISDQSKLFPHFICRIMKISIGSKEAVYRLVGEPQEKPKIELYWWEHIENDRFCHIIMCEYIVDAL